MAKKKLSYVDRAKEIWATDTTKAIATIVAVLLVPATILAWNYWTDNTGDVLEGAEDNRSVERNAGEESTEALEETDEAGGSSSMANGTTEETQGTLPEETESAEDAKGGLDSVNRLPDTAGTQSYTVQKGDNIYRISLKVCGDNSYYLKQLRKNYLKVGEVLEVNCD